jgi:hypothetical protein
MTRRLLWICGLAATGAAIYTLWRQSQRPRLSLVRTADQRRDEAVSEASEESFPASDAPSHTPLNGPLIA